MNNNLVDYFLEIHEELFVAAMTSFDKLGLFQPLTFRIEKQENL